ncbi:hypothetical protein [Pontibacter saemangeumensis]
MRIALLILFIALPFFSYAQGFKIKIEGAEFPTDKIPEHVSFPNRVSKISIKKEVKDSVPSNFIVQIGEEEHSFSTNGAYHELKFSHDIRGLVVYVLSDKRSVQGKPFILKKPK